jgi:hypothetical protein
MAETTDGSSVEDVYDRRSSNIDGITNDISYGARDDAE